MWNDAPSRAENLFVGFPTSKMDFGIRLVEKSFLSIKYVCKKIKLSIC